MDFYSHLPHFPFLYFPFPHLKIVLFANFLVPFLCYDGTICICWSVPFSFTPCFDLLWGFLWLSTSMLFFLIPPFNCSFCFQQQSHYPADILFIYLLLLVSPGPFILSPTTSSFLYWKHHLNIPELPLNISFPGEFGDAVMSYDLLQV